MCNDVLDSGIDDTVEIIFDEHAIFGPRVSRWYPAVKEAIELTNPERVEKVRKIRPAAPVFREDRECVPLQASDMLAWFLRTAFRDRVPGDETIWRNPKPTGFEWLAEQLLENFPRPSQYSTKWGHERIAHIQEMSIEMRNDPRMAQTIVEWQKLLKATPKE